MSVPTHRCAHSIAQQGIPVTYRVQLNHETGEVIFAGGQSMDRPKPLNDWLARQVRRFNDTGSDGPRKWCSDKEIERMRRGKVKGMDEIDIQAVMVGQAAKKIRDYSRHVRVWELDTENS